MYGTGLLWLIRNPGSADTGLGKQCRSCKGWISPPQAPPLSFPVLQIPPPSFVSPALAVVAASCSCCL